MVCTASPQPSGLCLGRARVQYQACSSLMPAGLQRCQAVVTWAVSPTPRQPLATMLAPRLASDGATGQGSSGVQSPINMAGAENT